MKVRLDNLQPWRKYYVQVRGVGDTNTEWSETYTIKTERDRIAPPALSNLQLSSEESQVIGSDFYWYGKDLIVTWDGYTADQIAASPTSTWDLKNYAIRFETFNGVVKTFFTSDKKFVLTNALNRSNFGGYGSSSFKTIYVYGVDSTGNPSNESGPWTDGPFWYNTDISTSYTNIINPPPDEITGLEYDFSSSDVVLKWTPPTSSINIDADKYEIKITDNYIPPSGMNIVNQTYQKTVTITQPYGINTYKFDYNANRYEFNSGIGSPNLKIAIRVIDIFNQKSDWVEINPVNEPPPAPVNLLIKPTDVPGEYTWSYDSVASILDYKEVRIFEKLYTSEGDSGTINTYNQSGTFDYNVVPAIGNSYLASDSPNTRRWVRAAHVDVFNQVSNVIIPNSDYPVQPKSTLIADSVPPNAPSNVTIEESVAGDVGEASVVKINWTPDIANDLISHTVLYSKKSDNDAYDSWSSIDVPAKRSFISSIASNGVITLLASQTPQSFQVGDKVSVVNGSNSPNAPIDVVVTETSGNTLTVSPTTNILPSMITGSAGDNTGTAVILSSTAVELQPGTEYKFKVIANDLRQSSAASSVVTYTTSGSPLVARQPLEIGTWRESAKITDYQIVDGNKVTITLAAPQSPLTFSSYGFAQNKYVSIVGSASAINGRYKITNVPSSVTRKLEFTITTPTSNVSTTSIGGTATAATFGIGANVIPNSDGIYLDDANYWFSSSGNLSVGNALSGSSFRGMTWNTSSGALTVSGDIFARSGEFSGNVFVKDDGAIVAGKVITIDSSRRTAMSEYNGQYYIWLPIIYTGSSLEGQYVTTSSSLTSINNNSIGGYIFRMASDASGLYIAYWINDGSPNFTIPTSTPSAAITVQPGGSDYASGKAYVGSTTALDSKILISTNNLGQIKYMLGQDNNNIIGGFLIQNDRLVSKLQAGYGVGLSASTSLPSFWAGSNGDPNTTSVWKVNEDGSMNLGNASTQGQFFVGPDGSSNSIYIRGGGGTSSKIYGGVGSWNNSNTPLYLDSSGQFSLYDFVSLTYTDTTPYTAGDASFRIGYGTYPLFEAYAGKGTGRWVNQPRAVVFNTTFQSQGDDSSGGTARITLPGYKQWVVGGPTGSYIDGAELYSTFIPNNEPSLRLRSPINENGLGKLLLQAGTSITFSSPYYNTSNGVYYFQPLPVTGSATAIHMDANGKILYASSSKRFKENIESANSNDLQDVLLLEPKTFRYKTESNPNTSRIHVGYIAEEVEEKGLNWLVNYDTDNLPTSISYDIIGVGLVEVAKAHQKEINDLKQIVLQLEERIIQLEEG